MANVAFLGLGVMGFPMAGHRVFDVDRDGRADLLVVGDAGEIRVGKCDASAGGAWKWEGSLVLRFPDRDVALREEGDYVLFGPGMPHSFRSVEESLVLTIRWPSIPA